MLRKLLTCLALLTGLAAGHAPVQAEMAVTLAAAIEAQQASNTASANEAGRTAAPAPRGHYTAADRPPSPAMAPVPGPYSVHLGSDRARE